MRKYTMIVIFMRRADFVVGSRQTLCIASVWFDVQCAVTNVVNILYNKAWYGGVESSCVFWVSGSDLFVGRCVYDVDICKVMHKIQLFS